MTNWETLKVDDLYEINVEYPHQIRRKSNKRILKESCDGKGYLCVSLNRKSYRKHRIIAIQWIENPLNLPIVDHINHNRVDNRIENLRWVSVLQNNNNIGISPRGRQIKYVPKLPEKCARFPCSFTRTPAFIARCCLYCQSSCA